MIVEQRKVSLASNREVVLLSWIDLRNLRQLKNIKSSLLEVVTCVFTSFNTDFFCQICEMTLKRRLCVFARNVKKEKYSRRIVLTMSQPIPYKLPLLVIMIFT